MAKATVFNTPVEHDGKAYAEGAECPKALVKYMLAAGLAAVLDSVSPPENPPPPEDTPPGDA